MRAAYDVDGRKIKHGDSVELLATSPHHGWLRKGCKFQVSHWDNRLGNMVVFLVTRSGRSLSIGMYAQDLRVVS